jgi:iron complex transport system ATP-binding protein
MIDIKGLCFSYNNIKILKDLNLAVNPGEIIGIIGKSGSGKTTLLKMIAGLLKGFTGSIELENILIQSLSPKELSRKVAYLFNTGNEDIIDDTLFNFLIRARKSEKKFLNPYTELDIQITEQYINQFQLNNYKNKNVLSLPGALYKNALIAYNFIKDAKILLLDNPTGSLDIHSILLLQKSLQRHVINGDRVSIIASNDLNFISQTADRIILLDNGNTAAEGKADIITSELIKKYFNVDVLISRNIYNGRPYVHLNMEL